MPRLAQTAEAHRNHQIQDSVALGEKSLWLTALHHTQLPNSVSSEPRKTNRRIRRSTDMLRRKYLEQNNQKCHSSSTHRFSCT